MAQLFDTSHQGFFGYGLLIVLALIVLLITSFCIIDYIYQLINSAPTSQCSNIQRFI